MAASKTKTEDKYFEQFAEMVIQKMKEISEDWKKPWLDVKCHAMPQNLNGRIYSGGNSLMLYLLQEDKGYKLPLYMTFKQAQEEGVSVKKGEKSFPVYYWQFGYKERDTGEKITPEDWKNLSEEEQANYKPYAFYKFYNVFNVEQTTLPELKPERWEELQNKFSITPLTEKEGMIVSPEMDYMLQNQTWLCPIHVEESDRAFFRPSTDDITIPLKKQFISGEEFYMTALHEMAHSTGTPERLNRTFGLFGDKEYSKEELIAELTSALTATSMGIVPTIQENNIAYLNGWMKQLGEDPSFIKTILADVNKSSTMIQSVVMNEEVKEKIKESSIRNINEYFEKKMAESQKRIPSKTELKSFSIKEAMKEKNREEGVKMNVPLIEKLYNSLKSKHPDAILLFRTEKGYECYLDDADKLAECVRLEIGKRADEDGKSIKTAGFKYEELETYLPKLIRAGNRVAICDQFIEPNLKKDNSQRTVQEASKNLQKVSTGKGIELWEEGDLEYKAHISGNRLVSYKGEFSPENKREIEELAAKGNIVLEDENILALSPLNKPDHYYTNQETGEQKHVSIENVDGKEYVCDGRNIIPEATRQQCVSEKVEEDIDTEISGRATLQAALDKLPQISEEHLRNKQFDNEDYQRALALEKLAEQIIFKFEVNDQGMSEKGFQEMYEIQKKLTEQTEEIFEIINTNKKTRSMETNEKEKVLKDGVNVFKMNDGAYGINVTKDGVRSNTKKLSQEDTAAYFEGLKGQSKEEVNSRREELAKKYFLEGEKQEKKEPKTIKPLPDVNDETKQRISNVSVFKMQDGKNYCVRAVIDGEQQSGVRLHPNDVAAFFDNYKGASPEVQDYRKAQIAAKYYKNELEAPKQEISAGMKR